MKESDKIKEQIRFATEFYHKTDDNELKQLLQDRISKLDDEYSKALKLESKMNSENKDTTNLNDIVSNFVYLLSSLLTNDNQDNDYIEPKDRVSKTNLENARKFAKDFIEEEVGMKKLNYSVDEEVLTNFLCYVFTKLK